MPVLFLLLALARPAYPQAGLSDPPPDAPASAASGTADGGKAAAGQEDAGRGDRPRYRKLPPQFPLPGWWARVLQQPRKVSIGAGIAIRPRYPGASATKVGPILFFDVEIKRKYFINVTDGIGLYFYRRDKGQDFWSPYYELKLSLAPGFENRSAKEAPGLRPVGKTGLLRLAGTVGYGPLAIDVAWNGDLFQTGHDGSFVTFALQGKLRAFGETLVSLGPEARYGNRTYMDSFYSVNEFESRDTGLPVFFAGRGFERVGGKMQAAYPLAPHWTLFSLMRYEALIGPARRSPVARDTSRFTFVFALGYRF